MEGHKAAYLKCHKTEQFIGTQPGRQESESDSESESSQSSISNLQSHWLQSKLISGLQVCGLWSLVSGLSTGVSRIETCRCGARLLWNSNFMKLIKYKFVVRGSPTGTQRQKRRNWEAERCRLCVCACVYDTQIK